VLNGAKEGAIMTFSVLLHDASTGEIGAGVASRFVAAGALVLHASAETGAVATQALVNVSFGPNGLRLLEQGLPADHVDPVPELRRLLALHTGIFTRADEADLMPLEGEVRTEVSELLRSVAEEPFDSADDDQLWQALYRWAGRENLEERLIRRTSVDPILVEALRRCANKEEAREECVTWSSNTSSSRSSR
jgi:uncharacterized Ntn-hydrolase superfamily protein